MIIICSISNPKTQKGAFQIKKKLQGRVMEKRLLPESLDIATRACMRHHNYQDDGAHLPDNQDDFASVSPSSIWVDLKSQIPPICRKYVPWCENTTIDKESASNDIPMTRPIIYPQTGWGKPNMWWANQPASRICKKWWWARGPVRFLPFLNWKNTPRSRVFDKKYSSSQTRVQLFVF